jgi:hypothetical protein
MHFRQQVLHFAMFYSRAGRGSVLEGGKIPKNSAETNDSCGKPRWHPVRYQ